MAKPEESDSITVSQPVLRLRIPSSTASTLLKPPTMLLERSRVFGQIDVSRGPLEEARPEVAFEPAEHAADRRLGDG